MDESPSEVGARAEREVAFALASAGWEIFIPAFGPHSRVDLVAVRGDSVLRVQVKTSTLRSGAIVFRTCSNTRNVPRSYRGEVDAFGVHSPETGRCYLVPAEQVPARGCHLRLTPALNNQSSGVRSAADFEVRPRR